jgi:HlyD family secretion protein
MTVRTKRSGQITLAALVIAVIGAAIFFAWRKPAVPVDLATVDRGAMAVTIDDEGETVVHDVFVVSAPIAGRLMRIDLEPGDDVERRKTILAYILPAEPGLLDTRTRAEALAREKMFSAQLSASKARVEQTLAERTLADRDLLRAQELGARGFATLASVDGARMRHDRAEAALVEARNVLAAARQQLTAARAALIAPEGDDGSASKGVAVTAPVNGTVLRVRQKSEAPVASGTPLVDIGDPTTMEVVADILSSEAVKVADNARVDIVKWGGAKPLRGKVRRIEPTGFTKVSALGVEEQRVNIFITITDPYPLWRRLGHGYRVQVQIETWSKQDAIRVPVSALSHRANGWTAYVAEKGRAHLKPVQIGHINDEFGEVVGGLKVGEQVILHPGDSISENRLISARSAS